MGVVLGSATLRSSGFNQWAPTRTFHDPNPPITLESFTTTQVVLTNGLVTFTFTTNPTSGISLTSFKRAGSSQVWTNAEPNLWSAKVYDTLARSPFSTDNLTPLAAYFTYTATATTLIANWTAQPVGTTDLLTVTVTLDLGAGEDWLSGNISAKWVTGSRYALDAISVLSLKIDPLNDTAACAVLPHVRGILSRNPISNLQYAKNGVANFPGFPVSGFGAFQVNTWTYPSGRGIPMCLWGYYDTASREGWMLWMEDWSREICYVTYNSNNVRMAWDVEQPQPDHVLPGNNGKALGSAYSFCLRPFLATTIHGWWDIAAHYKARIEANPPDFWVPKRKLRKDISSAERQYERFIDLIADDDTHTPGDGKPGDLAGMYATIKANWGIPTSAPIIGTLEAVNYKMVYPGETPNGDMQSKMAALQANGDIHYTNWEAIIVGPNIWTIDRWNQNAIGDQAEYRFWTANDVIGSMRMKRDGYLLGGGTDRLNNDSTGNGFYKERVYAVVSWNPGTKTLTVTGSPSGDGFTGIRYAKIIPPSSSAKMAVAKVSSLGASTIVVLTDFTDNRGNVVIPDGTFTVAVITQGFEPEYAMPALCPHALVNSTAHMNKLHINMTTAMWLAWKGQGYYFDVFSEPYMQQGIASHRFCYRDHSAWSKINLGYTPHPLGGGSWYKRARYDFIKAIKENTRSRQAADGAVPFCWITCEDMDETMHGAIDHDWHVVSSGNLWRNVQGSDPTVHKYLTIPLYNVVYAGTTMGRAFTQEFSTALCKAGSIYDDPALRKFLCGTLSLEWIYGMTFPALSLFEDNTTPYFNLWDNSQYVENGGLVANTVRQARDQWVQITTAEYGWITEFLRYGAFMSPAVVDFGVTSTTTSISDSAFTTFYYGYDTLYDHATFPRVVHGVWKADSGAVAVVFTNWTDTAGAWSGTIDLATLGLGAPGSDDARAIRVQRLDYTGNRVLGDLNFDPNTGKITLNNVPAYTIGAVVLMAAGGSMTRSEIEDCVLDFLQTDLANAWFDQNELDHHIRDGEMKMFTMVANKNEDWFKTTATLSEVASQSEINLPTNCYRVLKVERIVGNNASDLKPRPLRRIQRNTDDEVRARGGFYDQLTPAVGTTGFPQYYYQQGNKKIELFPAPSDSRADSLRITYLFRPAPMTSGAHVPFQEVAGTGGPGKDSLEEFHDIICKYAAYMLLMKEEAQQAGGMKQEMNDRIAELIAYLTPPNIQESKSIRDTDQDWF